MCLISKRITHSSLSKITLVQPAVVRNIVSSSSPGLEEKSHGHTVNLPDLSVTSLVTEGTLSWSSFYSPRTCIWHLTQVGTLYVFGESRKGKKEEGGRGKRNRKKESLLHPLPKTQSGVHIKKSMWKSYWKGQHSPTGSTCTTGKDRTQGLQSKAL